VLNWRISSRVHLLDEKKRGIATHNNWGGVPGLNAFVVAINMVGDEGEIYTRDEINNDDFQTGNISVDPQFMDATVPDVHLQPGSPCIDAGIDVGCPTWARLPTWALLSSNRPPSCINKPYSKLSARACQLASMILVDEPTVLQV